MSDRAFDHISPRNVHPPAGEREAVAVGRLEARRQFLEDLGGIEPEGTWIGWLCPHCYVNDHRPRGIHHIFDFVVRFSDRTLGLCCAYCGSVYPIMTPEGPLELEEGTSMEDRYAPSQIG